MAPFYAGALQGDGTLSSQQAHRTRSRHSAEEGLTCHERYCRDSQVTGRVKAHCTQVSSREHFLARAENNEFLKDQS
jgi:hypothetical protein